MGNENYCSELQGTKLLSLKTWTGCVGQAYDESGKANDTKLSKALSGNNSLDDMGTSLESSQSGSAKAEKPATAVGGFIKKAVSWVKKKLTPSKTPDKSLEAPEEEKSSDENKAISYAGGGFGGLRMKAVNSYMDKVNKEAEEMGY